MRVASYPSLNRLADNPYWSILRDGLETRGIEHVDGGDFKFRWLFNERGQVDILHFHYIQSFYASNLRYARLDWVFRLARNLLLAKSLGFVSVFTLHNLKPSSPLYPAWVDLMAHRLVINLCDCVIVHCEEARKLLEKHYGRRKKVFVVGHPNYIGQYIDNIDQQEARRRLKIEDEAKVLAFVGGIRPNKGIENLISTFREISDPRLRLLIAGGNERFPEYAYMIEKMAKDDKRIIWQPGFIPSDQMQVYYRAADLVVLPFKQVLTSGSVMLALSFGKPVVVPGLGCVSELITPDLGCVYDEREAGGLSAAIEKALAINWPQPDFIKKSVQMFSQERMVIQTLEAYLHAK